MQWLRRITLIFAIGIGLSVLALVVHTFWSASQMDAPQVSQRVQDLQILVIILLGLAGLYTVVFLLSPNMNERILRQHAESAMKHIRAQMSVATGDIRELREDIRQMLLEQIKAIREIRIEVSVPAQKLAAEPPPAPAPSGLNGREYLQLSGRLRILNNELVQVYQGLATVCAPQDHALARSYLKQALALAPDAATAAEMHYALACLLTKQGDLGEAVLELQSAFQNASRQLEDKLAKDTEEGGALYQLATTAPHDEAVNELLMNVSVGV